ncbi:hypothetical protein CCAX7_50420 [Capsulimonas corticalis]|uniref:Uncharacterized protein n=1 Tax=Capsulimonas corticalis TaxID=2219043 RepID=A0A402CPI6_9BACT|nr:hypothetical protein [Capsulimonas corticalis]BDI32991.1 hypothetical protein CCAX7_50420 [Capsulimonas corticalis]
MTPLEEAMLERYERFTSALVIGAMYGVKSSEEQVYAEVQDWMRVNDGGVSDFLDRAAIAESFRSLFHAKTLQDLLDSDEGDLIETVTIVSDALHTTAGLSVQP